MSRVRLVLLAVAALCVARVGAAAKADVYAIVGARVVPVSGPVIEGGTVILRDGIIEAVGASVTVPRDARVIDGKGLTLTPGLIDGFGGVGLPGATGGGGGGGRGGGGAPGGGAPAATAPAANALSPQSLALDRVRLNEIGRARDAGVTTALVVPREGVLPGRSVLLNLSGENTEGMVLRQPVALHLHMATAGRGQYPGSLMGTVAYARQALYDAQHYRDEWSAYDRAPIGKKRPHYAANLEAWQDVMGGRIPLMVTATRENDIRRAFALSDEFKVKVALAGAMQAWRVTDLLKARKVPLLVSVNFDPPRAQGGFGGGGFGGGGDDERQKKDIEEAEKNPAELHKAGISFALVSAYAPNFMAGVRRAIERGLPRDVALRAVTLGAAEALGVADRTGSLTTGKIANVVAWTAEPLTREARVKLVFVDGRLYEPDERPDQGGRGEGNRPSEEDR
jgi:imidazolonepropionase-like amidohydrolase